VRVALDDGKMPINVVIIESCIGQFAQFKSTSPRI